MRVRIKLIAALLIIILVPIIILSTYSSSKYTKMICQTQINALKTNNADKAAYINVLLRDLASDIKTFASDDTVRQFVTEASEMTETEQSKTADYTDVEIQHVVKKSSSVSDMFIIDNEGTIIAAYNRDNVGQHSDISADLESYAGKNNGISRIYAPTSGKGNYFYIVRRIYSKTNKKVGLVCQRIDLTDIGDTLKLAGYSNYAGMMIIDSDGKYIMSDVSTPKRIDSVAEYKGISEHLRDVIPFYGETGVTDTLTAEYDSFTVCGNVINAAGWSIVSIYDQDEAANAIMTEFSSVTVIFIIAVAAAAICIVIVCIHFTHPINTLISVINKLNRGDTNVRLDFHSNDEFGDISSAFNTMFDNIFESEQRYRTVVSMMDNVVFEINMKTYKVYVSNNFNQKFSFRAKNDTFQESFLNKMKIHKDDTKRYRDDLNAIVSSASDKWEGEYRLRNIYGDFSWIRIRGRKFYDRNNAPAKIIGMMVDIDREKKSAINLMQKANYDALTQLYNRSTFLRALDDEMQLSVSRRSLDSLMFIDLDDFKHFNDEFGHKCGDEVLKFVADTIKELTFDKGFGGRLGGDEFVMCLTNLTLIDDAGKAAEEMISILNSGFISESTGKAFNIHCSIGIAFFRENGGNSTELLEAADTAMYRIKKSGKSNFAYAGRESENIVNSIENTLL